MLSIVYIVVVVVHLSQCYAGGLTRSPQIDACPHLENPSDSNIKLQFLNFGGIERKCCGCPPGYYVAGLCSLDNKTDTICKPCGSQKYIEEFAHDKYSCKLDDLVCPANTIKIPSQPDQAPRCDCFPGHYKTAGGQCEPHSTCAPGEGVKSLGTPFQDTTCELCKSGYESPANSAFEGCVLKDSLYPPGLKSTSAALPPTSSTPSSGNTYSTMWIIIVVLVVVALLVVALIYCWWCNDFKCSKRPRRRNDENVEMNVRKESNKRETKTTSDSTTSESTSLIDGHSGRSSPPVTDSGIDIFKQGVETVTEAIVRSPSADFQKHEATPSSSGHSLPEFSDSTKCNTQQPRLSSYDRTMNKIKEFLSGEVVDDDAIYKMYRKCTTSVVKCQETFIKKLKKIESSCEKFCEMFEELKLRLGEDEFNPTTIHQYFVDDKSISIAKDLETFLLSKE